MFGLIESLIATSAVVMTCMFAGRIAAMMLTAVAAATAALIMPPFLAWHVERTTDLMALVFQSIVGLAVAYGWRPKANPEQRPVASHPIELRRRPSEWSHSLLKIARACMERDSDLMLRIGDVNVQGELDDRVALSEDKLEQILYDVIRMAFSDPRVQRVTIFTGRQPAVDQISVVAEYDVRPALPRFRLLGRSDRQHPIRTKNWPAHCSVTCIDNGFEHIYLISIFKRGAL